MDQTVKENGLQQQPTPQEEPKKVLTQEQKEKSYANLQRLMDSEDCIIQYELRLFLYNRIIRGLKRLDEYKDCPQLLEKYTQIRDAWKEEGQEEIYQNMLKMKAKIEEAEDIQWVRKEAARVAGYKDADEVIKWCDDRFAEMEKKEQKGAIARFLALAVVIVVVAFGLRYLYNVKFVNVDVEHASMEMESYGIFKGEPVEMNIQLTMGDTVLKEGVDYEVSYKKNDKPGKAKAIIKGMGKYRGAYATEFAIYEDVSDYSLYGVEETMDLDQIRKAMVLTNGKNVLTVDEDCAVACTVDKKKKEVTIVVTGQGDYIGTKSYTVPMK